MAGMDLFTQDFHAKATGSDRFEVPDFQRLLQEARASTADNQRVEECDDAEDEADNYFETESIVRRAVNDFVQRFRDRLTAPQDQGAGAVARRQEG